MSISTPTVFVPRFELSLTRLHAMRAGYLLMGLGLALVALPRAAGDGLDPATTDIAVNCSLVVVIIAVIPWRHVWSTYVSAPGDRWR